MSCYFCDNNWGSTKKCYLCFSQNQHHTIKCAEIFTAPQITLPKIDNDLLCRFLKVLHLVEKYSLAFVNPKLFHYAKFESIKVRYEKHIRFPFYVSLTPWDVVVADTISISRDGYSPFEKSIPPSIVFRVRHLDINIPKFSSKELLQLLSQKTKILICGYTEFLPNLEFSIIIKTAPKLEDINIFQTNIMINSSWPSDFIEFNISESLNDLHLRMIGFHCYIENLAKLFKKESAKNLNVFLYIDKDLCGRQFFDSKLLKYFSPEKCAFGQRLRISLCSFNYRRINISGFKDYVLKSF